MTRCTNFVFKKWVGLTSCIFCIETESFSDLLYLIWSVNDRLSTSVKSNTIKQSNLESDVAELLDENVSSFGAPKLFLVSCDLDSLRELLKQVSKKINYLYLIHIVFHKWNERYKVYFYVHLSTNASIWHFKHKYSSTKKYISYPKQKLKLGKIYDNVKEEENTENWHFSNCR